MTLPPTLSRILTWLDDHILIILAGFLLAFIPLFPKLPLFDAIPGYIVRVRLEDILILFTGVLWFVQVLRRKVVWRTPVFWLMVAYAVVGLLSVISAIVLTQTVPANLLHIGKTVLHYFRYLEYFSLFVIVFSAIKTKQQVKVLLAVIALTTLAVVIYGYGQKYYYWPVYSTMNREFSKGIRLYLTEHARVQSTFGGHYDLGAYLVVTLPLLFALALRARRWFVKLPLQLIHWSGVWLLIVSAARSSFAAYLAGIVLVIFIFALQQTTWLKRVWWGGSRLFLVTATIGLMFLSFGQDMYDRFLQVIEGYPAVNRAYHDLNGQRKFLTQDITAIVLRMPRPQPPSDGISTEEFDRILVQTDQRPVTSRPSDVYVDVPDIVEVATISATGAATTVTVEQDRIYSDCALQRGLSLCIRLDTLWPQAIAGFWRNPIVGSGYATLTKSSVEQFTEADSTDNNFLRTLGETGLLGFITFYGVIVLTMWYAIRHLNDRDNLARALAVGYIGGSVALLLNAVYIDVYAASKVALTYWGLSGVVVAYFWLLRKHPLWASDIFEPTTQPSVFEETKLKPTTKRTAAGKKKKQKRFANA